MRRREFIFLMASATTVWPLAVLAQEGRKVFRVGVLSAGAPIPELSAVSRKAFQELGWIAGKNIVFEPRYAENRLDQLPELAADLVRLKVDVIMANGTLAPLAAKRATATIPIVMTAAGDPIGSGLVSNLARPGENVTGFSLMVPDLGGKRLELLKEVLPRMARVAVLWNAANPYPALVFKETERAAQTLGIEGSPWRYENRVTSVSAFEAAKQQQRTA